MFLLFLGLGLSGLFEFGLRLSGLLDEALLTTGDFDLATILLGFEYDLAGLLDLPRPPLPPPLPIIFK